MIENYTNFMNEDFIKNFESLYGKSSEHILIVYSPARVNLLGDHIDYNGGFVFPCAINLYLTLGIRKNSTKTLKYKAKNLNETFTFSIDEDFHFDKAFGFANYLNGCLKLLKESGLKLTSGFDLYIESDIPMGSGLSSSAALELAIITATCELFSFTLSGTEKALLGKRCENEFLGLNSGIMDQFVIANAKADTVMLLNTSTLKYHFRPFILTELLDYVLVVMNSCKPRELVSSMYNERKHECEKALKKLQNHFPINHLCDLKAKDLSKVEEIFLQTNICETIEENKTLFKRVRHCINENTYTIAASKAFLNYDLQAFSKVMNLSHQSLKDDYEVSGFELDTLVSLAQNHPGCISARMTGAGFSGCAIAIVNTSSLNDFFDFVREGYKKQCNLPCEFYICNAVDGAMRML